MNQLMPAYGTQGMGGPLSFARRQARRLYRRARGRRRRKKQVIPRSKKAKIIRNFAHGASAQGLIGLQRTSGNTLFPVFLNNETLITLAANPGRQLGAVEMCSGGSPQSALVYLSAITVRDGNIISGQGFASLAAMRADGRPICATSITPVTPLEFTAQLPVAIDDVIPVDLGIKILA